MRALGATIVGLVVVWLVTAASDEGQLTVGARAGRTLPLAPLCGAVGAVLALGTARVRAETRALEALGRSPGENAYAAAAGAALPSIVIALLIATSARVDVSAFYPRAPRGDVFEYVTTEDGGEFVSPTLGVRVDHRGEAHAIATAARVDDGLPSGARAASALATAIAGVALALVAARAALRVSLASREKLRRSRLVAAAAGTICVLGSLVAFQAAAARVAPALLAVVPPALLLGAALLGYRAHDDEQRVS
jgi:hypothetical protein